MTSCGIRWITLSANAKDPCCRIPSGNGPWDLAANQPVKTIYYNIWLYVKKKNQYIVFFFNLMPYSGIGLSRFSIAVLPQKGASIHGRFRLFSPVFGELNRKNEVCT